MFRVFALAYPITISLFYAMRVQACTISLDTRGASTFAFIF